MRPSPLSFGPRNSARRIIARVQAAVAAAGLELDSEQQVLVTHLATAASRALSRRPKAASVDSFYIYGPPGRGKSWLMGLVHDALLSEATRRLHFHDFFRDLHASAHSAELAETAGDTAVEVALDELLGDVRVLCFDELHVHDPGDAMFFARTLQAVFARGILLIATSNYAPDDLLPNDYFHHLFEPTIELITSRMKVVMLDGGIDYRTQVTEADRVAGYAAGHIIVPGTAQQLAQAGLAVPHHNEITDIKPTTHSFTAQRAAHGQAWFDFRDLCDRPSAASDYLHLARHFDHVVIDGIPAPDRATTSAWKRLANLIDVLYDRDVRTDLICVDPPDPDAVEGHPVDAARLGSRLLALRQLIPGAADEESLDAPAPSEQESWIR
ncbi:cell division protein ZapE [Arthrobacter rhombi]|uniref:cell division protein ZapE n=1 Tax=Arthrobacter rhombi TaxID=71253 RepID=UPI003FD1CF60